MNISTLLDIRFSWRSPNADFDEGAWVLDAAQSIYLYYHEGEEAYYKIQIITENDEQTTNELAEYDSESKLIDEFKLIPWHNATTQTKTCYQCDGRIQYGEKFCTLPRIDNPFCESCYHLCLKYHSASHRNFIEHLTTYDRSLKTLAELLELHRIAKRRYAAQHPIDQIEKEIATQTAEALT
jgi:hypothetical protein